MQKILEFIMGGALLVWIVKLGFFYLVLGVIRGRQKKNPKGPDHLGPEKEDGQL